MDILFDILIKVLLVLVAALVLCLLIAIVRTLLLPKKTTNFKLSEDNARIDEYAGKLSRMVKHETISDRNDTSIEKFLAFHKLLEELFPTVFAICEKTEIDGNLLLKWPGKSSKDPIMLMSHMDVVEATGE